MYQGNFLVHHEGNPVLELNADTQKEELRQ